MYKFILSISNLVSDTISDNRFNEYYGVTEKEVQKTLADTSMEFYEDKMHQWYDSYYFGCVDIYCPWDVLNYVNRLLEDPKTEPESFWGNTNH